MRRWMAFTACALLVWRKCTAVLDAYSRGHRCMFAGRPLAPKRHHARGSHCCHSVLTNAIAVAVSIIKLVLLVGLVIGLPADIVLDDVAACASRLECDAVHVVCLHQGFRPCFDKMNAAHMQGGR